MSNAPTNVGDYDAIARPSSTISMEPSLAEAPT